MSAIRKYSVVEQEAIIQHEIRRSTYRLGCLLHRKRDDVARLAMERSMQAGVEEYGDASFHFSLPRLEMETMAELADGAFYQALYAARERGAL